MADLQLAAFIQLCHRCMKRNGCSVGGALLHPMKVALSRMKSIKFAAAHKNEGKLLSTPI